MRSIALAIAALLFALTAPAQTPTQLPVTRVALYRDHLDFLSPADRTEILSMTVQRVWPFYLGIGQAPTTPFPNAPVPVLDHP